MTVDNIIFFVVVFAFLCLGFTY